MLPYPLRNGKDVDAVFIKELHLLMDFAEEQIEQFRLLNQVDDKLEQSKAIYGLKKAIFPLFKQALIDYLVETVGRTEKISELAEVAGFGSEEHNSRHLIESILCGFW